MSIQPMHTGWTSVDELSEAPRTAASKTSAKSVPVTEEVHVQATDAPMKTICTTASHLAPKNQTGLWLSAISGVWIVLVGVVYYVGIDSLRGSITGSRSNETTVTITADGHFSPSSVTIPTGSMLTLDNKNINPQVIKVKTGKELFPTQVLFDKPYVFTVPSNALGVYTYASDTLPDDQTLTITVTAAIETQAAVSSSAVSSSTQVDNAPASEFADQIPIPFGLPTGSVPSIPSSASSVATINVDQPILSNQGSVQTSDQTAVINLSDTQAPPTEPAPSFIANAIAVNPYTVATAGNRTKNAVHIAADTKKLHSGAPLAGMRQYRPRTNASTGDALWLVMLPALMLMGVAYRRMIAV